MGSKQVSDKYFNKKKSGRYLKWGLLLDVISTPLQTNSGENNAIITFLIVRNTDWPFARSAPYF